MTKRARDRYAGYRFPADIIGHAVWLYLMNRSAASGVRLRRSWAAVLGDRAGKAAVDRAVQMAAEDALDLRMAGDDRSERLAVLQTGPVHAFDAGPEGRMVHHQQDRSRWRRGERVVEPGEPLRA